MVENNTADNPYSAEDRLCAHFWAQLNQQRFAEISVEQLAAEADISLSEAYLVASDSAHLALVALNRLDHIALSESAADFADAGDAPIYDKILEGLIHRFEIFAPYRKAMQHLHEACLRSPHLALMAATQLSETVDKLMSLAGDSSTGFSRILRRKGLGAVILRARSVWQKDETEDLSQTLKALDNYLREAQEWAVSLRVLNADETSQAER